MNNRISRRDFLQTGFGAVSVLGFSLLKFPGAQKIAAAQAETVAEIPVIWLAAGSCSGCSIALINTASPNIQELLLGQVIPGKHLSLAYHTTVMAAAGEPALEAMEQTIRKNIDGYVLVVDGAVSPKDDGIYCGIGEKEGKLITGYRQIADAGRHALAVLAVGACASFGGIPAAGANPTDCISINEQFKREKIMTPVVNIPGCPPHPDWIVGTVATLLLGGLEGLKLDEHGRPAPFYKELIHDTCPYRGQFDEGNFAERFGEHGCLLKLGCKGPITYADCAVRKFNNGTSWCCEAGHPCIGCCHPEFPFEKSLFTPITPDQLPYPDTFPPVKLTAARKQADADTYATVGMIGVAGFLAGVGVTAAAKKLKIQHEQETNQTPESDQNES